MELTAAEIQLITDAEIIHLKNRVMEKVVAQMGLLSEMYVQRGSVLLAHELVSIPPKISKGEQYLGLPYVMLDYPRIFSREHTFAIRTFFWWGNHFSIHLQLSGRFKVQYFPLLASAIYAGRLSNWYICINEQAWVHHFETDNYIPIPQATRKMIDTDKSFFKLAIMLPIDQWAGMEMFFTTNFEAILSLLQQHQAPMR